MIFRDSPAQSCAHWPLVDAAAETAAFIHELSAAEQTHLSGRRPPLSSRPFDALSFNDVASKLQNMSPAQTAVVENSKWVDAVVFTGGAIAGASVVGKSLGVRTIDVFNSQIPVTTIWIALAALTVGHFYTAWLLNRSICILWSRGTQKQCQGAFQEITAKGGLLVRGLSPRVDGRKRFGVRVIEMRVDDPSTWAAHALAVLSIAAIVPFDLSDRDFFGSSPESVGE